MSFKISPAAFLLLISFLLTGCSLISKNNGQNSPALQDSNPEENTLPPAPDPTADWETYKNEKYNYQVKHPQDWFFLEDACCPPPPAFVNLNNFSSSKLEFSKNQTQENVYGFDILCLYEGEIDAIGEVASQKEEGTPNRLLTINEFPAIKFTKDRTPDSSDEQIFIFYVVNGQSGCRITFSSKCPVCDRMLSTFKFTE